MTNATEGIAELLQLVRGTNEKLDRLDAKVSHLDAKVCQLDAKVETVRLCTSFIFEDSVRRNLAREYGEAFVKPFTASNLEGPSMSPSRVQFSRPQKGFPGRVH